MTKVKYREVPVYEEVEVIGKTYDCDTGTIDRRPIPGRTLITEAAGFEGKHEVVHKDADGETVIQTVTKIDENTGLELQVRLVGDIRSLATYKIYKGWTAPSQSNPGMTELFIAPKVTEDADDDSKASLSSTGKIVALRKVAERMAAAHPECDNQWEFVVAGTNTRVLVRYVDTEVDKAGKRTNPV